MGPLLSDERTRGAGMAVGPRLDPVLAFVDFLAYYRRSPACWDIGGPAAVDALRILGSGRTAGARLVHGDGWLAGSAPVLPTPPDTPVVDFIRHALYTPGCHAVCDAEAMRTGAGAALLERIPPTLVERVLRLADPFGRALVPRGWPADGRAVCLAEGGYVQLQFGGYGWQFVTAGTGPCAQAGLSHHYGLVTRRVLDKQTGRPLSRVPRLSEVGLALEGGGSRATWDRGLGIFFDSLARSVVASRPSLTVVAGPDAASSGRLFALFLHLASFARAALPEAGGVVEDGCYPMLLPMLEGEAGEWSSACHIRLARGSGAPGLMRVLHMVLPPDLALDAVRRRILARAERVWVAASADGRATQECLICIMGAAPHARVTLLCDPAGIPAGPRARVLTADVPLRCERYLGGAVSAEESAAFVRVLLERDDTPPL